MWPPSAVFSNIGFGAGATHTRRASRFADMPVDEVILPLRAPPFVIRDARAEGFTDKVMCRRNLGRRLLSRVRDVVG